MCRTTDHPRLYHPADRDRLKIKAFYLHLSSVLPSIPTPPHYSLPESLNLLFLPQLNRSSRQINGSKIRPGLPGFINLHRIINADSIVFGSRETVRLSEGTSFEVYVGEERLLKGIFRRDYEHHGDEWKVECNCVMERELFEAQVTEAEIFVAAENCGNLTNKVSVAKRRRRRCRRAAFLEEIPEEGEEEIDRDDEESCSSCSCDAGRVEYGSDDSDEFFDNRTDTEMEMMEKGMEGVRWAVDAGIWVMCLGVGYLVSKASVRRLRRRRIL